MNESQPAPARQQKPPNNRPHWGLRFALVINASLAIVNLGLWLLAWQQGLLWRADFSAFYTGWVIVWNGQGSQLYDLELQTQVQQKILSEGSFADQLLPFDYPPHTAWLFAPLAALPRASAFAFWTAFQFLLLLGLLRWVWLFTKPWAKSERWVAIITILAFTPLALSFMLGSFSLLLLVSTLYFYQALKQGRSLQGGIWLAAASLKPQSIVSLGFTALGARRWRLLFISAGLGLGLFVISSIFLGWQTWLDFIQIVGEVASINGRYGIVPIEMYNFKGLLTAIFGESYFTIISALSTATFIGVMAATVWLWRGVWIASSPVFDLRLAFTLLLGMVFSLHFYPQDSLLLVAPGLLVYSYLRQRPYNRQAFAALMISLPMVFFISEFFITGALGARIPTLILFGLTLWIGKLLRQEKKG